MPPGWVGPAHASHECVHWVDGAAVITDVTSWGHMEGNSKQKWLIDLGFTNRICANEVKAMPPGYEDELYCPNGFCVREKELPQKWVGPAHASHECVLWKGKVEETKDVTSWGFKEGSSKRSWLINQGFRTTFCAHRITALPPGYEDELYCPDHFCLRKKQMPQGWVGPAHASHECAGWEGGIEKIFDVIPWGSERGTWQRKELINSGYHTEFCPDQLDPASILI